MDPVLRGGMRTVGVLALSLVMGCAVQLALAQGFKFSNPDPIDQQEKQEKDAAQALAVEQILTPCRSELKDKKIMVLIGERQSNGYIYAEQQNYGPHYQAINRRLQALGLRTYTPEQIRAQIRQAEIDAYFKNDPDAMLSASKRLGASFVLRGLITSQATRNPMMAVNQVSVDMDFTLAGSNGRAISDARASTASYAGADVSKMALTLVNEKADEVVPKLYADYCRNAGRPANRPASR
jgi:hypothetical protein